MTTGHDVTAAVSLAANRDSEACYQGQTHGHEGFVVPRADAETLIRGDRRLSEVMFPFLTADELLSEVGGLPTRYVIDFHPRDLFTAEMYGPVFQRVKHLVLPDRKAAAEEEERRNAGALATNRRASVNRHHANFLARWWLLSWPRPELIQRLARMPRYIACGRVTKRPIFEFISSGIHPNDALAVFPLADDYSFGILQSALHWEWFKARCSTLEERFRYTSDTVFDSFPWPQTPSGAAVRAVADAAVALRKLRRDVMARNGWSLRDLYRSAELEGRNPLRDAQSELDQAAAAAYGMPADAESLHFILDLNATCADREVRGETIAGPGLPVDVKVKGMLITEDCVRMPARR